jgi:hypothetical protein
MMFQNNTKVRREFVTKKRIIKNNSNKNDAVDGWPASH